MSRGPASAVKRLTVEYRQLLAAAGSEDELFICGPANEGEWLTWDCLIHGPVDTPFEGGIFTAQLRFPTDYPLNPPKMIFNPPLLHPNIYANGEVCISILHAAGEDPNHYETASERWSPVQSVRSVLYSVVSMLAAPNVESPANIDAAKLFRTDQAAYEQRIRAYVRQQLGL